jgi:hypothetical protein
MPLWRVSVAESRSVEVEYLVRAKTETEASGLARKGETVDETFVRELGVNHREILDGPTRASTKKSKAKKGRS